MPVLVLCCTVAHANGAPFADRVGDADYWQTLDWSNAPSTTVWLDRNWVNYLGRQDKGEHRDWIQAFPTGGTEWQATLSRRSDTTVSPYELTIYTPAEDSDTDQCNKMFHWAVKRFGSPHIAVDGSYSLPAAGSTLERRNIDRHYQWDLGTTRITQECMGQLAINSDGTPQNVYAESSLRFTQKEASSELPPLVAAKCSRVLRLTSSSDIPLKMSDIAFIIDENTSSIRRPDLVPIHVGNVQVSRDMVSFTLTLDKSNNDYQIDRGNGQLSATMSISGIRAGMVSGQCTLTPILTAQPE
jgi:hypothetical protein